MTSWNQGKVWRIWSGLSHHCSLRFPFCKKNHTVTYGSWLLAALLVKTATNDNCHNRHIKPLFSWLLFLLRKYWSSADNIVKFNKFWIVNFCIHITNLFNTKEYKVLGSKFCLPGCFALRCEQCLQFVQSFLDNGQCEMRLHLIG